MYGIKSDIGKYGGSGLPGPVKMGQGGTVTDRDKLIIIFISILMLIAWTEIKTA
jgi:hypothetical protein